MSGKTKRVSPLMPEDKPTHWQAVRMPTRDFVPPKEISPGIRELNERLEAKPDSDPEGLIRDMTRCTLRLQQELFDELKRRA